MTRDEFNMLAVAWSLDTRYLSSVQQMTEHEAYQRIVAAGNSVVPFILEYMRDEEHAGWFVALYEITGQDAAEGETTVTGASQKWLEWGYENGYVQKY